MHLNNVNFVPDIRKNICITYKLENMLKSDGVQKLKNIGVNPQNNVTKSTAYFIGVYSSDKHRKALVLQDIGTQIEIISNEILIEIFDNKD